MIVTSPVKVVHRLALIGILLLVLVLVINIILTDQILHLAVTAVAIVGVNLKNYKLVEFGLNLNR